MSCKRRLMITLIVTFGLVLIGCDSQIADFHEALRSGNLEMAETLLAEKPTLVDTTSNGRIPIFEAFQQEQRDMVLLLIDSGVDLNVKDESGSTPLHYAAQKGYADVAELMTSKEIDINAVNKATVSERAWILP